MSEAEKKKEYDLFTDYNPEHYEVSWDNYKFTGFRTAAEYSAYTKAREDPLEGRLRNARKHFQMRSMA